LAAVEGEQGRVARAVEGADCIDATLVFADVRTLGAALVAVDAVVRVLGVARESVEALAVVRARRVHANVRAPAVLDATLVHVYIG
jgi:hypothetical protein